MRAAQVAPTVPVGSVLQHGAPQQRRHHQHDAEADEADANDGGRRAHAEAERDGERHAADEREAGADTEHHAGTAVTRRRHGGGGGGGGGGGRRRGRVRTSTLRARRSTSDVRRTLDGRRPTVDVRHSTSAQLLTLDVRWTSDVRSTFDVRQSTLNGTRLTFGFRGFR